MNNNIIYTARQHYFNILKAQSYINILYDTNLVLLKISLLKISKNIISLLKIKVNIFVKDILKYNKEGD